MGIGASTLSSDQELKIFRRLKTEYLEMKTSGLSDSDISNFMINKYEALETLSSTKKFVCPKVRFGRTELQMPVLTLGGVSNTLLVALFCFDLCFVF